MNDNKRRIVSKVEQSGLYVVCNDKNILDNVNFMLRKNGIICINDMGGRHHYLVDGRYDQRRASILIHDLIYNDVEDKSRYKRGSVDLYDWCGQVILNEYGFDFTHIGTTIIYSTIKNVVLKGREFPINLKRLCSDSAVEYDMTIDQMTRDIRYAVSKSKLSGLKTIHVVRTLYERIKVLYQDKMESLVIDEDEMTN